MQLKFDIFSFDVYRIGIKKCKPPHHKEAC